MKSGMKYIDFVGKVLTICQNTNLPIQVNKTFKINN